MNNIRALIVDDEPLARDALRVHLTGEADVTVVGECTNGAEAVRAIRSLAPDVVFLDVRMPDLSGFEVIQQLAPAETPFVVFVTAYDEYALRAFEVHALAYLLKPFDDLRFRDAMRHVRRLFDGSGGHVRRHLAELLRELSIAEPEASEGDCANDVLRDRLVAKLGGRTYLVHAEDIDWIAAAGDYARVHCGDQSYLVNKTMKELETCLDPRCFVRIHRSSIVNIDRIHELRTEDYRDYTVILRDGTHLRLSRTYRAALEQAIGDRI